MAEDHHRQAGSKLSDTLSMVSEDILPTHVSPRLRALFDELDQLLFLDATDELAVDRDTLIRLVNNEDFMPADLRDIAIIETAKYLGRRVKSLGTGRRITWREGEKYGLPIHPASKADLRAWGITKTMSIDELSVALKALVPELPDFWINEDSKQLADNLLHNFTVNRTFWDCLVANLGYWAAVVAIGSVLVFFAFVAEIGWQAALIWAIVYSGVATFYFIAQCAANPEFSQF